MLVTSCLDNVCRLWVETILPDDGLVDLEQFDPNSSVDPKFHTHRHKKRFLQRLKTIRYGKRSKSQKIEPHFYLLVAEVCWVSLKDFYFPLTFQTISPEILLSHRRAYHNFIYILAKKSPKILKACYQKSAKVNKQQYSTSCKKSSHSNINFINLSFFHYSQLMDQ